MNFSSLFKEDITFSPRASCFSILATLLASFLCLSFAPLLIPEGYSWISNAISESAAQGIHGAWLARLGFGVGILPMFLGNISQNLV